jgi:hypothetical protein
MKPIIRIEVQFSEKLQKTLDKEHISEKAFIGDLVNVYRKQAIEIIKPLKVADPRVKIKVYAVE